MSHDPPAGARPPVPSSLLTGLLARLDADQRRVAPAPPGPLLVLAGAGSGKTLALAARVAYAIASGRVAARHVLALSFTARAARELRERIARLAGPAAAAGVECATHHAVCHRLLRRHAHRIARTPRFSVYEPADVLAILRRALAAAGPGAPAPEAVAAAIARAKEALLTPAELRAHAPGHPDTGPIADAWAALEAELERSDGLDFDDLLVHSARLLRDDSAVLADARARWRLVLVDEFQDTNRPQWTWLELVGGERPDLTAMGDDDQAIYSWRGGAVGNILELDRRLPGTSVRRLERNYRSSGATVAAGRAADRHQPGAAAQAAVDTESARSPGRPPHVRRRGGRGPRLCPLVRRTGRSGNRAGRAGGARPRAPADRPARGGAAHRRCPAPRARRPRAARPRRAARRARAPAAAGQPARPRRVPPRGGHAPGHRRAHRRARARPRTRATRAARRPRRLPGRARARRRRGQRARRRRRPSHARHRARRQRARVGRGSAGSRRARCPPSPRALAEERRLAYVAITRARRELVLSHARRRDRPWNLAPSRFLAEALDTTAAAAARAHR